MTKKKLTTLSDVMAALPEQRRLKIEQRADAKVREIRALREIREAAGTTQEELARRLGINQTAVSKMERRKGMTLTNLMRVVQALGGSVEIAVKLTGREPVRIVQNGDQYEVVG
jgi:DNA-binding XRE family transcriptional regulator